MKLAAKLLAKLLAKLDVYLHVPVSVKFHQIDFLIELSTKKALLLYSLNE
jgi:hypothetical protein